MELYEYARPDLMSGKKILYLHGFASSGQNGTVRAMRTLLPETEIIAPDLPEHPAEAMELLRSICAKEQPALIAGTSMGGMYCEQLTGFDRIVVNPAFALADTILKNNGLGRRDYHNPRVGGETSFLVTKGLLEEFRECTDACFGTIEDDRCWGLFGIHDTLTPGSFETFSQHYSKAIRFDAEHYLNDHALLHGVMPLIQRIDDLQEGRMKKSVVVNVDDLRADNGSVKALRTISAQYDLFFLKTVLHNAPQLMEDAVKQADSLLGVMAWDRVLATTHKNLVLADYLIDSRADEKGGSDFMGTALKYGSDPFRTWEDIVVFFSRLGGQ